MAGLTIGKLAAAEGVGVETVRYYQRRGLLGQPERRDSGYREYSEADRSRLVFIRRARRLGFTLAEIGELLGPAEANSAAEIARAAQAKLAAVDEQVRELELLRCRLRRLLHVCEHGSGQDCAALQLHEQPHEQLHEQPHEQPNEPAPVKTSTMATSAEGGLR
jgi:DNA-binding transcriptional MerR regulator